MTWWSSADAGTSGCPLAIALADSGGPHVVYDVSEAAVDLVNDGVLPFDEPDAGEKLANAVDIGCAAGLDRRRR